MEYKSCSSMACKCHDGNFKNNCSASEGIYRHCEDMKYLYCLNWECLSYNTDYKNNCSAPDKFYNQCDNAQWDDEKWSGEDEWNDCEATL